MRGLFITFEGGEGCGKSTQTRLLAEKLHSERIPFVQTREPGGAVLSEKIRSLVVQKDSEEWSVDAELLLFMAARVEHWRKVIAPALAEGKVVLCDRFHDSSRVYQGIAKEIGVVFYDRLHQLMLGDVKPDVTFLLDVPAQEGLRRAATRKDLQETRFEQMELAFHERLRQGFLALAAGEPERFYVLDVQKYHADATHHSIWRVVSKWIYSQTV